MKPLPVIQPSTEPAAPAPPPGELKTAGMTSDPERTAALRPAIVEALSKVYDPEIPVNVYELGLIYDVIVDQAGVVGIRMTLTAPACPAAQFLPLEVGKRIAAIPGVSDVKVDVVWDPPWDRDRMSNAAKLQLGMF
jgi:FeS assembly SUF system protein